MNGLSIADEKYRDGKTMIEQRKFSFLSVPLSTNFACTPNFCQTTEKSIDEDKDLDSEKNVWSFDTLDNLLSPRPLAKAYSREKSKLNQKQVIQPKFSSCSRKLQHQSGKIIRKKKAKKDLFLAKITRNKKLFCRNNQTLNQNFSVKESPNKIRSLALP